MSISFDANAAVWLLVGLLAGLAVALVFARRGLGKSLLAAREAGRADREPEVVALQRDAQEARRERDLAGVRLDAMAGEIESARAEIRRLVAVEARVEALDADLAMARRELGESREQRLQAEKRATEAESRQQEQRQASADRIKELQDARERMKLEFQQLAQQILEEKSKSFSERNSEQLGHLLNPLREQIGDFRKLVSESYEKEGKERASLQTELKQLLGLNQQLSNEARSLTRALTSDNRTQGYWGELKLERLLESAGLEKGGQYLTQESFRDAEGDRYRPDAVLLLPEDRHIVIDAKMNLVDYQRACDATDEAEREALMQRHASAMRTHVRQLGEKDYSKLQGVNSPELVLMFIPVEAAFLEAVRRDAALYDDAFARRIVLVGPSNLLASLQLVAQMWRTDQQNRNTQKIMDRAAALYDKFVGFVDDLDKVRKQFDTARGTLDGAYAKLATGRGNLVRRAEELRKLGLSPGKRLPAALADEAGVEDDDADDSP